MKTKNIFCRLFGHRWSHYGMASKCFVCGEFWGGIEFCGICGGKILFKDEGKDSFLFCSKKGCLPKKNHKITKNEYLQNQKEVFKSKGIIPNFILGGKRK